MRKIEVPFVGHPADDIGALTLPPSLNDLCDGQLYADFTRWMELIRAHAASDRVNDEDTSVITLKIEVKARPPGYALAHHIEDLQRAKKFAFEKGDVVQGGRLEEAIDEAIKIRGLQEIKGHREFSLTALSSVKLSPLPRAGESLLMASRRDDDEGDGKLREIVQLELFTYRADA